LEPYYPQYAGGFNDDVSVQSIPSVAALLSTIPPNLLIADTFVPPMDTSKSGFEKKNEKIGVVARP
jgi:hypothetical protein